MTTNPDLVRIFGSDLDALWLAPIGTTLPTDIDTALDAAFEDVGWLHSDGLSEELTGSRTKLRGHQGNGVIRTRITEPGTEISFHALETKNQTQTLRYYEKTVTTDVNGVRKAVRSSGQRVARRAAVIDLFDADNTELAERFAIPVFEIVANGARQYAYTEMSGFPFLGEIIGDYTHYSNGEGEGEGEGE